MLNIKRGLLALLLVFFVLPSQAGAQQSGQDDKKRGKRPPMRARVVTDSRVGIRVVVAGETRIATGVVPVSSNVQILFENGVAPQPTEPEIENWLMAGPVQPESWLDVAVVEPPAQPVAAAAATRSAQLLGVQHYMESTQAGATDTSSTADPPAVTFTLPPRVAGATPAPSSGAFARPAAVRGTYLLGPGDEIDVHVWRNPDLSRKVPVLPDGLISLPLAGELLASGKTVAQLKAEITAVLGEFVQSPTVTVTVTQVRSMVVYVTGRVARSGTLTLDRPINVVQAITMAGGVQEFADRNGVVVIRTVNGRQVRIPFRYGDAVKGKGDIAELILQAGDVVYVP